MIQSSEEDVTFQNFTNSDEKLYIKQKMVFFVVEQNENRIVYMKDFFAGTLLNYTLQCTNLDFDRLYKDKNYLDYATTNLLNNGQKQSDIDYFLIQGFNQNDTNKLIRMDQPIRLMSKHYMDPFKYLKDPNSAAYRQSQIPHESSPRTSLIVTSEDAKNLYLFVVDRELNLYCYNLTSIASNQLNLVYQAPLDTNFVNGDCQDMIFTFSLQKGSVGVYTTSNIYIFCTRRVFEKMGKGQNVYYEYRRKEHVNVLVLDALSPNYKINYLIMNQTIFDSESSIGLRLLGYEFVYIMVFNKPVFLAMTPDFIDRQKVFRPGRPQIIVFDETSLVLDFSLYRGAKGEKNFAILNQSQIETYYQMKYRFVLPREFHQKQVLDFSVFNNTNQAIALSFETMVLACFIEDPAIYYPTDPNKVNIFNCTSSNSSLVQIQNSIGFYQPQGSADFFYIVTSYPASVIELDSRIYKNLLLHKIYTALNDKPTHIGTNCVAVNFNAIVHLMRDVETQQNFLRFYDRRGNRFEVAKYDFPLDKHWIPNFVTFPSYFFNLPLIRDDEKIMLVSFSEWQIVFDATQTDLLSHYIDNMFECRLTVFNSRFSNDSFVFNVTIIDENNTQIYRSDYLLNGDFRNQLDLFYSCGDSSFQMRMTTLFYGPDYSIQNKYLKPNCNSTQCYFILQNQNTFPIYKKILEISSCQINQIFPQFNENGRIKKQTLLVCIDEDKGAVSSYIMDYSNFDFYQTAEILFPFTDFIAHTFDQNDRALFFLSNSQSKYISGNIDVHFFYVSDTAIIWQNSSQVSLFKVLSNLTYENIYDVFYDPDNNRGCLLFQDDQNGNQALVAFVIDFEGLKLSVTFIEQNIKLSEDAMVLRAIISKSIVLTLNMLNQISMFFIVEAFQGYRLTWIQNLNLMINPHEDVVSFELFQSKYLIVYFSSHRVDLYTLEDEIYSNFRMSLPKYSQFYDYKLTFNVQAQSLMATSFQKEGLFALLLKDSVSDSKSTNFHVLIYQLLSDRQHNALVYSTNVTDAFLGKRRFQIQLYREGSDFRLVCSSEDGIHTYLLKLFNYIKETTNPNDRNRLNQDCLEKGTGSELNSRKQNMQVLVSLNLTSTNPYSQETTSQNTINLNVYTENQGLLASSVLGITPFQSTDIYFSAEKNTDQNLTLLLQEYFNGFSLSYLLQCDYLDIEGKTQSCNDAFEDHTQSVEFQYNVEFVTSKRKAVKVFIMWNYFFIIDSYEDYHLLAFPKGSNSEEMTSEQQPLEDLQSKPFNVSFGCDLDQYIDIFEFEGFDGRLYYQAVYQCLVDGVRIVKVAEIGLEDDPNAFFSNDIINIFPYENHLKLVYPVQDIKIAQLVVLKNDYSFVGLDFVISCDIPDSFTNILFFLRMEIDLKNGYVEFKENQWITSLTENRNTFKVTQIESLGTSSLVLVIDKDRGVLFYDTIQRKLIFEIDIIQEDEFYQQMLLDQPKLIVYSLIEESNHTLHIITNFGIYIYTFAENLREQNTYKFTNGTYHFSIIRRHIIRKTLEVYNQEVAKNQYGYAFLATQFVENTVDHEYLYLISISYFAKNTNKMMNTIRIGNFGNCNSLLQSKELSSSSEDMIAVSLLCDNQIFVYRLQIKPFIKVDFSNYTSIAKNLKSYNLENGAFQYNPFTLHVTALASLSVNQVPPLVKFHFYFKDDISSKSPYFLTLSLVVILVLSLGIIIMNQCWLLDSARPSRKKKQIQRGKFSFFKSNLKNIDSMISTITNNVEEGYQSDKVHELRINRLPTVQEKAQSKESETIDEHSEIVKRFEVNGMQISIKHKRSTNQGANPNRFTVRNRNSSQRYQEKNSSSQHGRLMQEIERLDDDFQGALTKNRQMQKSRNTVMLGESVSKLENDERTMSPKRQVTSDISNKSFMFNKKKFQSKEQRDTFVRRLTQKSLVYKYSINSENDSISDYREEDQNNSRDEDVQSNQQ